MSDPNYKHECEECIKLKDIVSYMFRKLTTMQMREQEVVNLKLDGGTRSDPSYKHEFDPNRHGKCKTIVSGQSCHLPESALVHMWWQEDYNNLVCDIVAVGTRNLRFGGPDASRHLPECTSWTCDTCCTCGLAVRRYVMEREFAMERKKHLSDIEFVNQNSRGQRNRQPNGNTTEQSLPPILNNGIALLTKLNDYELRIAVEYLSRLYSNRPRLSQPNPNPMKENA